MAETQFEVGRDVLLVSRVGMRSRLYVTRSKIVQIYKNGLILVEGTTQKFRADGTPAGRHEGWHDVRPRLKPWDPAIWQKYQMEREQDQMATKIHTLGQKLQVMSRDPEGSAKVWEMLPFSVRCLIEQETPND
ncbi:hypothetical protein PhaeoP48_01180 [Phaeobacter inhibens]|uniref:hypothetical protein n=1 Tax=Phaeobacter inhibens TaxID=221822 RepID=UPI000C9B379C|nr:hypothetical protein [Phaeobacter inhibens]AUR11177.1 hypothetical protein PhaeoP48_01180 [Phaeobacter inhibens]